MSAVSSSLARALLALAAHVRAAALRAPLSSLFALAVAGAAAVLTLRRPRGRGARGRGGRARRPARPHALAGVRRITVGVDVASGGGPLFERVEGVLAVSKAALPYLRRLAKMCDLYVIAFVGGDEAEQEVCRALHEGGVFLAGMDERKVLFCETPDGRISVVRQLEPHLHIDARPSIVAGLKRFIKLVAVVAPEAHTLEEPADENVFKFETLESFWTPQPA